MIHSQHYSVFLVIVTLAVVICVMLCLKGVKKCYRNFKKAQQQVKQLQEKIHNQGPDVQTKTLNTICEIPQCLYFVVSLIIVYVIFFLGLQNFERKRAANVNAVNIKLSLTLKMNETHFPCINYGLKSFNKDISSSKELHDFLCL